ncbi:hypothetical protein GCM10025856_28740 [Methylophaga marina]|uniref:hypothetical protein n=1 Tax=Methylophaga marina TaxID=45495 RepID=UPI002573F87A|nr:hypothetical protein [Methylophaga marina]BDZ75155.1 hypothetical protein GCM10025856_28740 [Methylophaga marina]
MQDLETLNRLFAKEAKVCFVEGQTGMPIIEVSTKKLLRLLLSMEGKYCRINQMEWNMIFFI